MNAKGFTLIELMVTVFIVAVLAALCGLHYAGYANETRATEAMGMIKAIQIAQKYHLEKSTRYFDAATAAQFKAHGIEITYGIWDYEAATGPDNVVIRATRPEGWIELELSRNSPSVWRCDGDYITSNVIGG